MTDVAPETEFDVEAARSGKGYANDTVLLFEACVEIDRLHSLLLRAEEEREELRQAAAPFLSLWISPKAYHRLRAALADPEETND